MTLDLTFENTNNWKECQYFFIGPISISLYISNMFYCIIWTTSDYLGNNTLNFDYRNTVFTYTHQKFFFTIFHNFFQNFSQNFFHNFSQFFSKFFSKFFSQFFTIFFKIFLKIFFTIFFRIFFKIFFKIFFPQRPTLSDFFWFQNNVHRVDWIFFKDYSVQCNH